jgi:hypothetical protein
MAAIMSAAFKVAVTLTRMAISPWYYQPSREKPPSADARMAHCMHSSFSSAVCDVRHRFGEIALQYQENTFVACARPLVDCTHTPYIPERLFVLTPRLSALAFVRWQDKNEVGLAARA